MVQKWEHMLVLVKDLVVEFYIVDGKTSRGFTTALPKFLADVGRDGWEMVGLDTKMYDSGSTIFLAFKRPLD